MAKSKKDKKRRKEALLAKEDGEAQADSNGTSPALRTPEEPPALRTPEEAPALRTPEEDTSRLSASSEEAALDTSLSAKGTESAPALPVSGEEPQSPAVKHLIAQAMRFLKPDRPAEQKTTDSVKPVRQPEPKGLAQWTVMKRGKETTAVMTLFEKASAAQETSPPSHLSITKPKQANLTRSWLEQRAQDQGAA